MTPPRPISGADKDRWRALGIVGKPSRLEARAALVRLLDALDAAEKLADSAARHCDAMRDIPYNQSVAEVACILTEESLEEFRRHVEAPK